MSAVKLHLDIHNVKFESACFWQYCEIARLGRIEILKWHEWLTSRSDANQRIWLAVISSQTEAVISYTLLYQHHIFIYCWWHMCSSATNILTWVYSPSSQISKIYRAHFSHYERARQPKSIWKPKSISKSSKARLKSFAQNLVCLFLAYPWRPFSIVR
jgi:hypothetical protein